MKHEPLIAVGSDLRSLGPHGRGGVWSEKQSTRFPRNVCSDEPRGGLRSKALLPALVDVPDPCIFRLEGGRNTSKPIIANVADALHRPIHQRLGGSDVVADRGCIDGE